MITYGDLHSVPFTSIQFCKRVSYISVSVNILKLTQLFVLFIKGNTVACLLTTEPFTMSGPTRNWLVSLIFNSGNGTIMSVLSNFWEWNLGQRNFDIKYSIEQQLPTFSVSNTSELI